MMEWMIAWFFLIYRDDKQDIQLQAKKKKVTPQPLDFQKAIKIREEIYFYSEKSLWHEEGISKCVRE